MSRVLLLAVMALLWSEPAHGQSAPPSTTEAQPPPAAPASAAEAVPANAEPASGPLVQVQPTTAPVQAPPVVEPTPASPDEARRKAEASLELIQDDVDARMEVFRRGPFSLTIGGMLQVQGAFYVGNEAAIQQADPFDSEGFRIRRARLGFGGTLLHDWQYYLAVDIKDTVLAALGGDEGTEILDATITWARFPFARVSAGVDKVPYSLFALMSSGQLELLERPLGVRLISPDRRAGLTVHGDVALPLGQMMLQYAVGAYNGSAGITSGNRLAGMAAGAHVQLHIFGPPVEFVPGPLRLSLGGSYLFDDTEVAQVHRAAGNLELRVFRARLVGEFLYEATRTDTQPTATGVDAGDSSRWAAVGELSFFLFRDLLQAALRYEYFQDSVQSPLYGKQQLFTGGLNFYIFQHRLKLSAAYVRRHEMDGTALENDVAYAQAQAMF